MSRRASAGASDLLIPGMIPGITDLGDIILRHGVIAGAVGMTLGTVLPGVGAGAAVGTIPGTARLGVGAVAGTDITITMRPIIIPAAEGLDIPAVGLQVPDAFLPPATDTPVHLPAGVADIPK